MAKILKRQVVPISDLGEFESYLLSVQMLCDAHKELEQEIWSLAGYSSADAIHGGCVAVINKGTVLVPLIDLEIGNVILTTRCAGDIRTGSRFTTHVESQNQYREKLANRCVNSEICREQCDHKGTSLGCIKSPALRPTNITLIFG